MMTAVLKSSSFIFSPMGLEKIFFARRSLALRGDWGDVFFRKPPFMGFALGTRGRAQDETHDPQAIC